MLFSLEAIDKIIMNEICIIFSWNPHKNETEIQKKNLLNQTAGQNPTKI